MFIGEIGPAAILAAGDSAESGGHMAATLLIPIVGVGLLIAGLVVRSRTKVAAGEPVQVSVPVPQGDSAEGATTATVTAPAPVKSSTRTGTILAIVGAVVLVLGLLGNVSRLTSSSNETALDVGNCVSASDYRGGRIGSIPATACEERDAVYELASIATSGAACPDGKLKDAAYFVLSNGSKSLCFAPNVRAGDCYRMQPGVNQITPTDCSDKTSPGTAVQVSGRFDGTTDAGRCAIPQAATVTPQPARVVCWGPAPQS